MVVSPWPAYCSQLTWASVGTDGVPSELQVHETAHGLFGAWAPLGNMTVTMAEPLLACGPLSNGGTVDGGLVVVERGSCTFFEKATNAQAGDPRAAWDRNSVRG